MSIRAGSASNRKGGDIYAVKKIYQHPDFDRAVIDFDYALLELEDEIELDETKQIVKLHDQDEEIADGTTCTISGWGNTQDGSDQSLLRKGKEIEIKTFSCKHMTKQLTVNGEFIGFILVETKIVNQEKCANAYKNVGKITPRMICAGADEGGKDSCQGDSGGPLTVLSKDGKTRLLAGIVSWGYGCAVRGYPGVYSRVLGGRDWIKEISGI